LVRDAEDLKVIMWTGEGLQRQEGCVQENDTATSIFNEKGTEGERSYQQEQ
jgi:hypothetical protein